MKPDFERFARRIYRDIKSFDPRLHYVDANDVLQEIRFAILTAHRQQVYRVAHRLIDNLLRDYGFSRRKGKDNFDPFYDQVVFTDDEQTILNTIEQLYVDQNLTAREVAQILDLKYNNQFQKILCACFPKHLGKGGKRKNAGNNKHLKVSTL